MGNWVQRGAHKELAESLYGLAAEQQDGNVPGPVSSCDLPSSLCRGRTIRLKEVIFGVQGRARKRQSSMNRSMIDTLDSHFRHLGQPVGCSDVKGFLPGLLDPSLEVRIPTPITVHMDQCPQCANDLRRLRQLGLDAGQLRDLESVYEQEPTRGFWLCRRVRSRLAAFVRGAMENLDAGILDHLSVCPRCRADVYAQRQALLKELRETSNGCCDHVPAAHLLRYAVPSADRAHDGERPGASHVGTCRTCLETIQAIHRTVYGIGERPESGVVTLYRTVDDSRMLLAQPDDPYAPYGVSVEVVRSKAAPVATHRRDVLKSAAANPQVRRILKTAVAAAAIIPLAALFLNTQSASGITLAKVFRALGRAENVRVAAFDPVTEEVVYEAWVARGLNLQGMMTDKGCFVYDLSRREKEDVDSGEVIQVSEVELANVRQLGDRCLGFSPADVPTDARWNRASSDEQREVYELTWTKQTYAGRVYDVKHVVAIDKATMLPENLRMFRRESPEAGWTCKSIMVLQYPSQTEMRSIMTGQSVVDADRQ